MPPVLHITPPEVDTHEKRSKFRVAVVGCGNRGISYSNAFADAGFSVICTDSDASVVKRVAKGKTAFGMPEIEAKLKTHIAAERIDVTSDLKKAVALSDVIIIAITARLDEQKKSDYTGLINICKQIGATLHPGVLVVYGGIAGLGFMEGTIKALLEDTSGLKAGVDFGLAYSPIVNAVAKIGEIELKVAATDRVSLGGAATILRTLTGQILEIGDLRTAETVVLFNAATQDITRALTNELAIFCETANIDYYRVLDILNLNTPDFRPTIAEEENKTEAYLLLEGAENLNAKLKVVSLAREINEDMVKHAVNLAQEGLRTCGKTLRRGKVAVLGPANKSSGTDSFVRLLAQKGARVTVYDPSFKKEMDSDTIKTSLNEAVEGADCIVVLSANEQFNRLNLKKLKALTKSPAVLVDLAGKFEPSKVDTEGFLYCGLGRGTELK